MKIPPPDFSGHLHLAAEARSGGRTVIGRQSFRMPFHLGKPYWDGKVLQVRIVNATAGILAGDELELDVRAGPKSALLVITPAATRAFFMRRGVARCRQSFSVGAGAWMEYAPEPLFPHKESDYSQNTLLDVAKGGEACFAEALAPGRAARGETWAWRRLQLALEVRYGGEPVLRERFDGSGGSLARLAKFYGMTGAWFGTLIVVSARLTVGSEIRERLRELESEGTWIGLTRLRRGGWIVRVIAPGGQMLRDKLSSLRGIFSGQLPFLGSDLRKV